MGGSSKGNRSSANRLSGNSSLRHSKGGKHRNETKAQMSIKASANLSMLLHNSALLTSDQQQKSTKGTTDNQPHKTNNDRWQTSFCRNTKQARQRIGTGIGYKTSGQHPMSLFGAKQEMHQWRNTGIQEPADRDRILSKSRADQGRSQVLHQQRVVSESQVYPEQCGNGFWSTDCKIGIEETKRTQHRPKRVLDET